MVWTGPSRCILCFVWHRPPPLQDMEYDGLSVAKDGIVHPGLLQSRDAVDLVFCQKSAKFALKFIRT